MNAVSEKNGQTGRRKVGRLDLKCDPSVSNGNIPYSDLDVYYRQLTKDEFEVARIQAIKLCERKIEKVLADKPADLIKGFERTDKSKTRVNCQRKQLKEARLQHLIERLLLQINAIK